MKKLFLSILALATGMVATATPTSIAKITITGTTGGYGEITLVEDAARNSGYEDGYDGRINETFANDNSLLFYGVVGTDKCDAVFSNDLTGTELVLVTNKVDNEYTMTFNNLMGADLTLYDRVEKVSKVINSSTPNYTFTVTAEQVNRKEVTERFIINYVAPTFVYMNGDFDNPGGSWDTWPGSFTADGSIYSQELTLAADSWYHFKLIEEYSPDQYTAADGTSFDRDNNSHNLYVNTFTSALLLHTDVAGTYTFTWNDLTDNLTITFPAAPVPTCTTVRSGMVVDNYYTICLPKAVTAANGASFWNMSNRGAGVAYLEEAELPLVAGRPYIIQAEDAELCVEYSGDDAAAGAFGALHGTLESMDQAALNAKGSDVYLLKNNELRLVSGQDGNSLAADRAYIKYDDFVVSTPNPAPGRRVRAIPMQDQSTTGVENLNAAEAPIKTVIDGKMYILRGEHMFDATGRMVK